MTWEVVGRPVGKNEEGKNSGHLLIELRSNGGREEIARVAVERKEAFYKDKTFHQQVDIEVGKALKLIEAIKTLSDASGKLR